MVEYVEREALLAEFYKKFCAFCPQEKCEETCKLRIIKDAITSIPAANVREVKRGKWATVYDDFMKSHYDTCSCCGKEYFGASGFNFCPNCGADMRGEADGIH